MADGRLIIGYSQPKFIVRNAVSASVAAIARGVNVSLSLNSGDASVFYADDGEAEKVQNPFTSGTISMEVDGLKADAIRLLFGTTTTDSWIEYNKSQESAHVAVGFIVKTLENGVIKYLPYVLSDVIFKNPGLSAATQGETIEFQNETLEGTFYADSTTGVWKYECTTSFAAEAAAVTAMETKLLAIA